MDQQYRFEISLSVLNHLGRGLYRDIITILGEAISNSWDADAKNVWINFDKNASRLVIMDDGEGMDENDFQNKFLKIGYSKRKDQTLKSKKRSHPFIGAKGIGKLALLSCSKRISIFSKKKPAPYYVGGLIDNSGLDEAIKGDKNVEEYNLQKFDLNLINDIELKPDSGTILVFDCLESNLTKHTDDYYRKLIALYFNFSIFDNDFKIHFNGSVISVDDLTSLIDSTEFLWVINEYQNDNLLNKLLANTSNEELKQQDNDKIKRENLIVKDLKIYGFIASVKKPRDLKIPNTDERVTIDLFTNGRLREKDILRHIPSQRIVENYLYGQIHFDELDSDGNDPFTSNREGVISGNKKFQSLLDKLKSELQTIFKQWDKLRVERSEDGDEENDDLKKGFRKALSLINQTSNDYVNNLPDDAQKKARHWLKKLETYAANNINSYADCFISENLLRMFIDEQKSNIDVSFKKKLAKWEETENRNLKNANISYEVRKSPYSVRSLNYFGMIELATIAEGNKTKNSDEPSLNRSIAEYNAFRNVIGHTGFLTETAQKALETLRENIKARVTKLLDEKLGKSSEYNVNLEKNDKD